MHEGHDHGEHGGGGCCGGGGCGGGGCCSPELTMERLEKKEKWLEKSLEWVKEKKEELTKADK